MDSHQGVPDQFFAFQSWEAISPDSGAFTSDITPLTLAAHRNNYEIIKILLDRGATLPTPHDARSVQKEKETLLYYITLLRTVLYCR